MNDHPSLFRIYLQLMKLRVVVLLQITAICAILAHDLMVRSDAIPGDRTWLETLEACLVTLLGGTLAAGGSNAINMVIMLTNALTRMRDVVNGNRISHRYLTHFTIKTCHLPIHRFGMLSLPMAHTPHHPKVIPKRSHNNPKEIHIGRPAKN